MIIQYHQGAINNVDIYLDKHDKHSMMDPDKTLEESGVVADAD